MAWWCLLWPKLLSESILPKSLTFICNSIIRHQWTSIPSYINTHACVDHIRHVFCSMISWWRHQMETFSVWLAGEFPAQRPVTRSFDVFFDLRLNKRLSKQSWGWRFETLSRPLWRYCNADTLSMIFRHFPKWPTRSRKTSWHCHCIQWVPGTNTPFVLQDNRSYENIIS